MDGETRLHTVVVEELLSLFLQEGAKKLVGDLSQDTGSVSSDRVCVDGPAMSKIFEGLERFLKKFVGTLAVDIGDDPDAACVVFEFFFVQER